MAKRAGVLRKLLRLAFRLVIIATVLVAVALLLLQIPLTARWIARTALESANPWKGTTASIGDVRGSWITSLHLYQVSISNPDQTLIISFDTLSVSYNLPALLRGEIRVNELILRKPVVRTDVTQDGTLSFLAPFMSKNAATDSSTPPLIAGERVTVSNGELILHSGKGDSAFSFRVTGLTLSAHSIRIRENISASVDTLDAGYLYNRVGRPGEHVGAAKPGDRLVLGGSDKPVRVRAAGSISDNLLNVRSLTVSSSRTSVVAHGWISLPVSFAENVPDADFQVVASPITYEDLTPFIKSVGPDGQARISLRAKSSGRRLEASGQLEPVGGGMADFKCSAWNPHTGILAVDLQAGTKALSIAGLTGSPDSAESITSLITLHGEGRRLNDLSGNGVVTIKTSSFHGLTRLNINSTHDIREGVISSAITGTGGPLEISLKSRISPFASVPDFDIAGNIVLPLQESPSSKDFTARLAGLRCAVHLSGKGFDPESSNASADLRGNWERNTHLRSFTFHSTLASGTIHATAELKTRSGEAGVTADAVLGDQISYSLAPLYFSNIDLAYFLGEKSRSSLTGTLAVKGRGTAPATITGEAVLDIKPSKLLGIDIQTLTARLGIINGATDIEGSALTGGGSFGLKAKADFQADRPFAEITDFTFHNLNLMALGGVSAVTTDLNGTLSARASASSSDGLQRLAGGHAPLPADSTVARSHLILQESKVDRQRLTGGSVDAILREREVSLSLDVRTTEGGFSSEAVAHPFEESLKLTVPLATFEHVNLGSLFSVDGLGTDLSGTCSIRHQGSSLETAGSRVNVHLSRSSINKEPLTEASIEGELDSGKVSVTTTWTFEHGQVGGKAEGALGNGGFSGSAGVAVRMEDLGLLLNDGRFSPSRITADVAADGTWSSPEQTRMHATLHARGQVDSLEADSVLCRLSVTGRTILLDTLLVRSNVGLIEGSGSLAILDTTGESVSGFSATAILHSLKPIEHLFDLPSTELDSAKLSCMVTGPAHDTQIAATAAVSAARIGNSSIGSLDVGATGSFKDLAAQGTARVPPQVTARLRARDALIGNFEITRADVTLASDGKRHEIHSSATISDSLHVQVAGAFVPEGANSTILLDSLVLIGPKFTWNLQYPASIIYGEKLLVHDIYLRARNQSIRANGVLDPKGEQNFTFRADSLEFGTLAWIIRRPELDGTASVELRVTGAAVAARAAGSMTAEIRTQNQPVGHMRASIDWRDSLLSINGVATQPGDRLLTAEARIPRTLSLVRPDTAAPHPAVHPRRRPMDVQLRADRFRLEMIQPLLDPQTFGKVAGILTADITGRGTMDSLSYSGRLAIDSGFVRLPSLGVSYDGMALRCSLEGSDLQLDSAYIHSAPGYLAGRGTISFRDLDRIAPRLHFSASNFLAIQIPQTKVTASGELEVTGTTESPIITGKIVLGETEIQIPDLGTAASVQEVELTPDDYRMLLEKFGVQKRPVEVKGKKSSFEGLTIGIDVEMRRNTWIRKKANPNLAIEMEGQIRIERRPGKLFNLAGELRPVTGRSYVGQFGRQFDITGGEIYFSGKPEDLELRIDSDYKVPSKGSSGLSEVVIHMRVMSKLGRFTFELTSDPAMAESDILTYLATGKSSTGALAGTADQGNLGSAAALEQLVGAAQGLTEGKVPLDVFQIRQDGARGITIVAGNYISNRLYVGVRQPLLFEQGTQATTYDTGTQGEFEYEATPWLFLNFQGGADRIMLFCKSRYVY